MSNILTFEQIAKGLKDKRLYAIAKEINVSYPTLRRLSLQLSQNYTYDTLLKVSNYIKESAKIG